MLTSSIVLSLAVSLWSSTNGFGKRELKQLMPHLIQRLAGRDLAGAGWLGTETAIGSQEVLVLWVTGRQYFCCPNDDSCPLLTSSARSHAGQGQEHGWWCASALMEKGLRIWAVKSLISHRTESSAMCRTVLEMLPGALVLGARYDHKLFLFVNRFVDIP